MKCVLLVWGYVERENRHIFLQQRWGEGRAFVSICPQINKTNRDLRLGLLPTIYPLNLNQKEAHQLNHFHLFFSPAYLLSSYYSRMRISDSSQSTPLRTKVRRRRSTRVREKTNGPLEQQYSLGQFFPLLDIMNST